MLRRTPSLVALLMCALATLPLACTPSSNGPDAGAGGEGEGEGEGEQPAPYCRTECTTPADCVIDNAPPHVDEDNYACNAGACEYLGCLNEGECDALGMNADTFTCYRAPGFSISLCVRQCTAVSDCVGQGASGAQDEDNYECDDGACLYLGCNDDDECVTSLGAGARCVEAETPFCAQGCEEPVDCVSELATAPYDEDNFECVDGTCRHLGCLDDDECAAVADDQICR